MPPKARPQSLGVAPGKRCYTEVLPTVRHDSDSTSYRLRTHARKAKLGYPEGNGSRSYCSSIITMQFKMIRPQKRYVCIGTCRHAILQNLGSGFEVIDRFRYINMCKAKKPIKIRVIALTLTAHTTPQKMLIYNNIKKMTCQAFQSLQTLTK